MSNINEIADRLRFNIMLFREPRKLSQTEEMTVKWLQTTTMPNNDYPYYVDYFAELLANEWNEDDLLKLPPHTFAHYEMSKNIMTCTISDFAKAIIKC
jgi:hypothetical protein